MAYMLNANGQPFVPTTKHRKVRLLLKNNKTKVINRCPFAIYLIERKERALLTW
jgi:hypothetical protein